MNAKILYSLIALFMIGLAGCGGKTPDTTTPPVVVVDDCRKMEDKASCDGVGFDKCEYLNNQYCVAKGRKTDLCTDVPDVDAVKYCSVPGYVKKQQNCVVLNGKCQKKPESTGMKDFRTAIDALVAGFNVQPVMDKLNLVPKVEQEEIYGNFKNGENIFHVLLAKPFSDASLKELIKKITALNPAKAKDALKFQPVGGKSPGVLYAEKVVNANELDPIKGVDPVIAIDLKNVGGSDENILTMALRLKDPNDNEAKKFITDLVAYLKPGIIPNAQWDDFASKAFNIARPKIGKPEAIKLLIVSDPKVLVTNAIKNKAQNVGVLIKELLDSNDKDDIESIKDLDKVLAEMPAKQDRKDAFIALLNNEHAKPKVDFETTLKKLAALSGKYLGGYSVYTRPKGDDDASLKAMVQELIKVGDVKLIQDLKGLDLEKVLNLIKGNEEVLKKAFKDIKTDKDKELAKWVLEKIVAGDADLNNIKAAFKAKVEGDANIKTALSGELIKLALQKSGDVFSEPRFYGTPDYIDQRGIEALTKVVEIGQDLDIKSELFKNPYPKFSSYFKGDTILVQIASRVGQGKVAGDLRSRIVANVETNLNREPFIKLVQAYKGLETDKNEWKKFAAPIAQWLVDNRVVDNIDGANDIMQLLAIDKTAMGDLFTRLAPANIKRAKEAFDAFVIDKPGEVKDFVDKNIIHIINALPDPANDDFAQLVKDMAKNITKESRAVIDEDHSKRLVRDVESDKSALAKIYEFANCRQTFLLKALSKAALEQKGDNEVVQMWKVLSNKCPDFLRGALFEVSFDAGVQYVIANPEVGVQNWKLLGDRIVEDLIEPDTFGLAAGANLKDLYKVDPGQTLGTLLYVMIKKVVALPQTKAQRIAALEPVIAKIKPAIGTEADYNAYIKDALINRNQAGVRESILTAVRAIAAPGVAAIDVLEAQMLLEARAGITAANVSSKIATAIVPGADQKDFDWLLKAYLDQEANPGALQNKVNELLRGAGLINLLYIDKKLLSSDAITVANAAEANIFATLKRDTPLQNRTVGNSIAASLFEELKPKPENIEKLGIMFNDTFKNSNPEQKIALREGLVRGVYESGAAPLALERVANLINSGMISENADWAVTKGFNPWDLYHTGGLRLAMNDLSILAYIIRKYKHDTGSFDEGNVKSLAEALKDRVQEAGLMDWNTYLQEGKDSSVLLRYATTPTPGKDPIAPAVSQDVLKDWFLWNK